MTAEVTRRRHAVCAWCLWPEADNARRRARMSWRNVMAPRRCRRQRSPGVLTWTGRVRTRTPAVRKEWSPERAAVWTAWTVLVQVGDSYVPKASRNMTPGAETGARRQR